MKIKEFLPITRLVDDGLKKEIRDEIEKWNTRKGIERYPLSPSQIGKCGLMLARNLAHYMGVADYPRDPEGRTTRLQRIFARGHLLESALIDDITRLTHLEIQDRQKEVTIFKLRDGTPIKGSIDGIVVQTINEARVLIDMKSKGAYYSAGFNDSISEFFMELRETGLVEVHGTPEDNCFLITDVFSLFNQINLDDFFVDYLLQLNAYAFAEEVGQVDFVALYYENKNTCANYEVRWVPDKRLLDYAKNKFQFIYDTVTGPGPEHVEKEFSLGSARCRLCEYNETCYGAYTPKPKGDVVTGELPGTLNERLTAAVASKRLFEAVETEILAYMENKQLTHVTTRGGMTYERKFLKSPKPHYELRLTRG